MTVARRRALLVEGLHPLLGHQVVSLIRLLTVIEDSDRHLYERQRPHQVGILSDQSHRVEGEVMQEIPASHLAIPRFVLKLCVTKHKEISNLIYSQFKHLQDQARVPPVLVAHQLHLLHVFLNLTSGVHLLRPVDPHPVLA